MGTVMHTNLPRTNPVVTKPIGHRIDCLLVGSSGNWSSHLLEDSSLKYDLTEDSGIWSPISLLPELQYVKSCKILEDGIKQQQVFQ